jgi:hypothetical protein
VGACTHTHLPAVSRPPNIHMPSLFIPPPPPLRLALSPPQHTHTPHMTSLCDPPPPRAPCAFSPPPPPPRPRASLFRGLQRVCCRRTAMLAI